jgi:hypothetical protein
MIVPVGVRTWAKTSAFGMIGASASDTGRGVWRNAARTSAYRVSRLSSIWRFRSDR